VFTEWHDNGTIWVKRYYKNGNLDGLLTEWDEDCNKKVEDLFFTSLGSRRSQYGKQKIYASEQACLTCHSSKHETWNKSRHGHAYETLNRINKAFDQECLACYVAEWGASLFKEQ
jgi:antitoxin component YwqK of YwqJK toxin-antitoxin module